MLRVIGDIHGKISLYKDIVFKANEAGLFTLQLGDLGFGYEYGRILSDERFNLVKNKFFMGNHDQYNYLQAETDNLNRE